jgi:hypothetical protein
MHPRKPVRSRTSRSHDILEGELQRRVSGGGAINFVAESIHPLNNEDEQPARVKRLSTGEQTTLADSS